MTPSRPHRHRTTIPACALALCVLALAVATPSTAAGPAEALESETPADRDAPRTPEFSEAVSVSWMLVPVVVRTRDGYADDLGRDDFRLWVDGRRVPIDEVDRGSDAPLSVVWLQDLSGSMANAGKLETSRRAFRAFLDGARPGDEIALASFAGGAIRVEVPFTDNVATLREAAGAWDGYGTTALHDAVSLLPELSAEGSRGKRVAILVTDGQDNASQLAPDAAVELVRSARLPVYVLGLRSPGTSSRPGGDGSGSGAEADTVRYEAILRDLAERTGGRYADVGATAPAPAADRSRRPLPPPPDGSVEAETAVATILDDLRLRYILAVTTAGEGPKSYHRLRVEAALPELRARGERPTSLTFRRGYFGTEPLAWHPARTARRSK